MSCISGDTTSTSCPSPDLMLEIGDRVGVLVPPEHIQTARAFFGDTVKATAEFSYISVGLGMVLGVLLGLVPIPLPGVGTVTLGIGGGPLIVALIVGRLRRTGPISWVMPLPANIVLRNFGLTLFLATVGINSGQAFLTTVAQTGPVLLLIGAVVVLTTILIILLVGHFLLRIPYDDLLGVASGRDGQSRDPGLCQPHGADRADQHQLRHDLPVGDHREGRRRADRGARPARLSRIALFHFARARQWPATACARRHSVQCAMALGTRASTQARDRRNNPNLAFARHIHGHFGPLQRGSCR